VGIKPIYLIHPSKVVDVLTASSCALQVPDRVSDGVTDRVLDGVPGEGLDGGSDRDFDMLQEN